MVPKPKKPKPQPKGKGSVNMPRAGKGTTPLNKSAVDSGRAKITSRKGKRFTVESKDQKTEWIKVPKRGYKVTKNTKKA
jgi:hypothetical protein